ncbi:MAG TPA: hypothetical protein VF491_12355 [Vicinamibacterales bacterium]
MAILIEGLSVVVRCQSIVQKTIGGVDAFKASLPNDTLRSDGEIAAVHFMTPADTKAYVLQLVKVGLVYRADEGAPVDIAVVDQRSGPTVPCDWLDFGEADWDNDPEQVISVCCARPTRTGRIVVPEGWVYKDSLTANAQFVAGNAIPPELQFLRHQDGVDVLLDTRTGREYFVRRNV